MRERTVVHTTFTIERGYAAPPAKVFAAFADPAKKRRWFAAGGGRTVTDYSLDFRVGGYERGRYRFAAGQPLPEGTICANDTLYEDILENRRIVLAYTMSIDERRISCSQGTFELLPAARGTDLIYTEQAAFLEGADGEQLRTAGWRSLLEQLAQELAR